MRSEPVASEQEERTDQCTEREHRVDQIEQRGIVRRQFVGDTVAVIGSRAARHADNHEGEKQRDRLTGQHNEQKSDSLGQRKQEKAVLSSEKNRQESREQSRPIVPILKAETSRPPVE